MSLDSALRTIDEFTGAADGRIHAWLAIGTPRGTAADFHREVGEAAAQHGGLGITMHCAEAPKDLEIFHEHYNCSPMQFCENQKLATPKTVLAHMVNLDFDVDAEILQRTGTTVAHNPSSNCKLGSGIAQVVEMLDRGINVSLGTDGAPCANTYDMIREMHLASLVQSGKHSTAGILSATTVLEMATINGAKALGLENEIGSLEIGKKADFVVVNPYGLDAGATPFDSSLVLNGGMNPVTALVHSCTGRDVEMVVVDGKVLISRGKLLNVDEGQLVQQARAASQGIRQRSGIMAQKVAWPIK